MKRLLLALILLVSATAGQAGHAVNPENLNLDKSHHLAVGAALGAIDFRLGCGAGLAKEAYDSTGAGTVEFADFAYTCAGAAVSSWLGQDRSKLYKFNAVTIILDGISTDNAIRQGGFEVGYPKYVIGTTPNTAKIAAFTIFRLWLLEESESWSKGMKGAFQWGTAITGPWVVYGNYSLDFK